MRPATSLLFLTAALASGCGEKYKIKDEGVYLKGWNEGNGNYEILVEGADPQTFQTVETDCDLAIGKDKNYVYIEKTRINNFDPSFLRYVGNYYFVDNDSVYFFGFYNFLNDCEVVGANPKEIKLYDRYPWAYDDKYIIYGHKIIDVGDISKFKITSENWGRTDDKIIYQGRMLDSVDIETFEIIDEDKAKDKFHKFEYGKISK